MSGPPSMAGTCWTDAATNVPTIPTVRIAILTARFTFVLTMVVFLFAPGILLPCFGWFPSQVTL